MKRFLSLFLVLCTLLCLFPMAVSAEEAAPEARAEATASYLDLYVKDGLVALFDGYSATAGKNTAKLITPAALYGVAGYDDYVDPSLYTADIVYTGQGWGEFVYAPHFVDGAIAFKKVNNGNRDKVDYKYYVDLDDLGAILGTTYTVQEIFTLTPQLSNIENKTVSGTPVIENGVVTNWSTMANDVYANDQSRYGTLNLYFAQRAFTTNTLTGTDYASWSSGGLMTPWIQVQGDVAGYGGHVVFAGAAYGTKYAALNAGADYTDAYVCNGYATIEQTVIRNGYTTSTAEDGTVTYTSQYSLSYAQAPEFRKMGKFQNGNMVSLSSAVEAAHTSTALRIMATTGADYYSARIYNKVLSSAEIAQNHFADLLGFYKVDGALIAEVLALPSYLAANLYTEFSATQIVKDGYADAGYADAKAAFETALAASVAGAASNDYISLYEKDGLVAIFDGHSGVAGGGTAAGAFAPVNLYGVAGYEDYIDPTTYTAKLTGNWTWVDGALRPANYRYTNALDLNELGALLDQTYTLQEILGYTNTVKPTVSADGASFDNTGATNFGTYCNSAVGPFTYGILTAGNMTTTNPTGTGLMLNFIWHEQIQFGAIGGGATYKQINVWATPDYNVTTETVGGVEFCVGGPAHVERTTVRLGVTSATAEDGTTSYTSSFKVIFAFPVNMRTGNSHYLGAERTYSHTSDAEAQHYSTVLRPAGQDGDILSVRVYDDELSASAIAKNHMADLVAFYDIDVDDVKALSALELAIFIDAAKDIRLAFGDKNSADYAAQKAALEAALNNEEAAQMAAYVDMYVKDGLVALFDFHGVKATDGVTVAGTENAPSAVDLSGVAGYDDYIAPGSYATFFSTADNRVNWVSANGGMQAKLLKADENIWVSTIGFNLDALGALIGTTYSVQEVFSYVASIPTVAEGVITNYTDLHSYANYGGGWEIGALKGGTSPSIGAKIDGVNNVFMVPVDQLGFNGGYNGHWTYFTNDAATLYESLTAIDADGNTIVDSDSAEVVFENYYVASTSTWERTFIRLGYTATENEVEVKDEAGNVTGTAMQTTYTSTYKTIWNVAPWGRPGNWGWKQPNTTMTFSTTDNEAPHQSTSLILANNGLTRSIRVYNKELTQAEVEQNHVADLFAVYGTDIETIAAVKALPAAIFAEFATAAFAIEIGETDTEWAAYEADFNECIAEYLAKVDALIADVLTFGGFSYRTVGDYGIRALFSVDTDAVATLEECGYTVEYGAVMAIMAANGNTYNNANADVTVEIDEDGKVVLASGEKAAIVSSDNGLKHLTEDNASFAFTTTYRENGDDSALYDATMIYRGFVTVTDAEGNTTVAYDEGTVADVPALVNPSLNALHAYVLDNSAALPEDVKARLEGILG